MMLNKASTNKQTFLHGRETQHKVEFVFSLYSSLCFFSFLQIR